jgi:hypothetical protein
MSEKPTLPEFKVGDRVHVIGVKSIGNDSRPGDDYEATVAKVGRRWLVVGSDWRQTRFDRATGLEAPDYRGMHCKRLVTDEMLAYESAYRSARERVQHASGATPFHRWSDIPGDLSTDQLNRIADILEEPRS